MLDRHTTVHNATVCVDYVEKDTFIGKCNKNCFLFAFSVYFIFGHIIFYTFKNSGVGGGGLKPLLPPATGLIQCYKEQIRIHVFQKNMNNDTRSLIYKLQAFTRKQSRKFLPRQPVLLVKCKGQTEALTDVIQKKRKHILVHTINNLHRCISSHFRRLIKFIFFPGEYDPDSPTCLTLKRSL